MRRPTPAEKFYAYLEDWVLRQRAQHGEDVAKERLRARTQDDQVTDHVDGRTWRYKAYARDDW